MKSKTIWIIIHSVFLLMFGLLLLIKGDFTDLLVVGFVFTALNLSRELNNGNKGTENNR